LGGRGGGGGPLSDQRARVTTWRSYACRPPCWGEGHTPININTNVPPLFYSALCSHTSSDRAWPPYRSAGMSGKDVQDRLHYDHMVECPVKTVSHGRTAPHRTAPHRTAPHRTVPVRAARSPTVPYGPSQPASQPASQPSSRPSSSALLCCAVLPLSTHSCAPYDTSTTGMPVTDS
jgi:hypothetical protein